MKKVFHFDLTIEHPVVSNHTVEGQALLPGLAYIDMLYQLAKGGLNLEYGKHSLKRLAIFNPLTVSKDRPVRIKVTFERKQKYWSIKVEGAEPDMREERLYITAELHQEEMRFEGQIDIEGVKQCAVQKTDIKAVYAKARKAGLVHKEMIKAEGTVYLTGPGCLIDVRVDELYRDEEQSYLFHPALIDGAGMGAMLLVSKCLPDNIKDKLFLPLSYELFYSKEPLRDECYVKIDRSSIRQINDIFSMDMDFYNTSGEQIAELKGLTSKLVRHQDQMNPVSKKEAAASVSEDRNKSAGVRMPEPQGGIEKERGSQVEMPLKKIFSKYLNKDVDQIEMDAGFFELGLESSQLLGLVKDIEDIFNLLLSPSLLFEYSNLNDLIGYLENKLAQDGTKHYEEIEMIPEREGVILKTDRYEFYENEPYLQDHQVYERPALMDITHPCLAVESYIQNNRDGNAVGVKNVRFIGGPIGLNKNESVHIQVKFNEGKDQGGFKTTHYVKDSGKVQLSCTGEYIGPVNSSPEEIDIKAIISQSKPLEKETIEKIYHITKKFKIGPMLQTIGSAYEYDKTTLICEVDLSGKQRKGNVSAWYFDPLLLSICYMLSNPEEIGSGNNDYSENVFVPLAIDSMIVYRVMTEKAFIVKKIRSEKTDFISFDSMILTETGEMIGEIVNATMKSERSTVQSSNLKLAAIAKTEEAGEIAIIGLSGRYPGAGNLEEFWDNLRKGKDCITEIPVDRWNWKEYFDEDRDKPGKIYSKWGGFLEGVDEFDPLFFNISPREAEVMDPQERLFLECGYETLEDAGYTRESIGKSGEGVLGRKIGVYAGVMWEDYQLYGVRAQERGKMIAVGGNPSSIANRVSYVFNFNGPSMAVSTMCSSSLTAIHLACQSIERGECEAAIAGGVNVSIHPNKYLMISQGKFVSSTGRCESFGKGGDGYVPGEGVGTVLLKPLSKAIEDGDHVYGVIRGSTVNAGGKTSGYTVPNPAAQGELIKEAMEKAGVNARSISYMEAHGTGTSLGDPIEIAGLTKAFRQYTEDKQFCAIGSVKSNIGHCESAAGIAAVTKVLLQLKNRELVPSLHAEELNPNIDFRDTPFVVQRELSEWKSETPRIAGISSFGAGGTNVHIVIEEYIGRETSEEAKISAYNPVIIVLSARNEERLKEKVKNLMEAIERERYGDEKLADIAYTLQVGREGMEERFGIIVNTIKELREKLGLYLNGKNDIEELYEGQVKKNKETLDIFRIDKELNKVINKWIEHKELVNLLKLWVKGLELDWDLLYDNIRPHRISLPKYPFARERYWIDGIDLKSKVSDRGLLRYLHPLLHENTSSLIEQRFSSVFNGDEFFITDHIINGRKLVPEVIYLEMARAAVEKASELNKEWKGWIRLKSVVWAKQVEIDKGPMKLNIKLTPGEEGEITYEVYSKGENDETVVHNQGTAEIIEVKEEIVLDIKDLQGRKWDRALSSEEFYTAFSKSGIEYGPGYRGIDVIYSWEGEALVKLIMPASVQGNEGEYILHPGIMDSALQAVLGLLGSNSGGGEILPVSLESIEIIGSCVSSMWAVVRQREEGKESKFNVDLCDEGGKICVRVKGLSLSIINNKGELGLLMFEPEWKEEAAGEESEKEGYAERLVFLCEPEVLTVKEIKEQIKGAKCIVLQPEKEGSGIDERYQTYVERVIEEIRRIMEGKPERKVLIQAVVFPSGEKQLFSGLLGILKTAKLENPKIIGQLMELEGVEKSEEIIKKLEENRGCNGLERIKYREGKRLIERLKEVEKSGETAESTMERRRSIPDHGRDGWTWEDIRGGYSGKSKEGDVDIDGAFRVKQGEREMDQETRRQGDSSRIPKG